MRFTAKDWLAVLALFVVAVAMRAPFGSRLAYHWDSAVFVLAINEYNLALSQPHVPGYFLYVMLGKLLNQFVGDPHAGLVWVSMVFGSGLTAVMYLLGAAMFGRRAGLAAGVFGMTSPVAWFHSCVALTYVVDALLVCAVVWCCWRAMKRGGRWTDAAMIGVLLAVMCGVRLQSVPGLIPLVLFALWRFEANGARKLALAAGMGVLIALWFAYMVNVSGGWPLYLELVRRHAAFNAPATLAGGGWNAFVWNVFLVGLFCWNGLALAAVVLIVALLYRAFRLSSERKRNWDAEHALALRALAIWIVPMVLMATAVGFTKQPGYVLSYLPGLLLLAGVAVAQLRKRRAFVSSTALVCAVNVVAFVAWPCGWDGVFLGRGRSACEIREHDEQLARTIHAIRSRFNPKDAVLIHGMEFLQFGLRHFQLHLPEFDQYQLSVDATVITPPDKPLMSVQNGRLVFGRWKDVPADRALLLVVPPGREPGIFQQRFDLERAQPLEGSGKTVYVLRPGKTDDD